MADELSERFYRRDQPSQDDVLDRLRNRQAKAMDFINEVVGQYGLGADQLSDGHIVLHVKGDPMATKIPIITPATYRVRLYRNGVEVMEQSFSVKDMMAEDIGEAAGTAIADTVQAEEARRDR